MASLQSRPGIPLSALTVGRSQPQHHCLQLPWSLVLELQEAFRRKREEASGIAESKRCMWPYDHIFQAGLGRPPAEELRSWHARLVMV